MRAVRRVLQVFIHQADGNHESDNYEKGRNSTEPCGAYGCNCEYPPGTVLSPGNC